MQPKYAIIGCGHMSQYYIQALTAAKACIAYVVDLDKERAEACARQTGAKAATDFHIAVNDPNVTAVVVVAFTPLHEQICLAAIQAGKDVICEKTLADNPDQSFRIAQAALKANVIFFTAYMKRFFPAAQKAKELLAALGTLYSIHARSYQYWGDLFETADIPDHIWLPRYGGGVLKCAGSHILDLLCYFAGRPTAVCAYQDFCSGSKLDRKATALFRYPGALTACFETVGHSLKRIGYQRNGWDERLEINGTKGRLDLYTTLWNKSEECSALLVYYNDETETASEFRYEPISTFIEQMTYFHNCLCQRQQGHPGVIDGFNVDVLIHAIGQAHQKKAELTIDYRGL